MANAEPPHGRIMSDPTLPTVTQTFRAGLHFAARWIIARLSYERFTLWLTEQPAFAHVPPARVVEWYDFLHDRPAKRKGPPILTFLPLAFVILHSIFISSMPPDIRRYLNAAMLWFIYPLLAAMVMAIVMHEGRISINLKMLASTYRFGTEHRLGRCLSCGYNVTGVGRDDCPECGSTLLVESLIKQAQSH